MMKLGKMTDYAIVVLTAMARHGKEPVSSQELAQSVHLERTTVAKILKALTKRGLILSYRGANGGYRLAKSPDKVSVGQIIEAMEGPIGITECSVSPGACSQEAFCSLQSSWKHISEVLEQALFSVSLAQIMAPKATPPLSVRLENMAVG